MNITLARPDIVQTYQAMRERQAKLFEKTRTAVDLDAEAHFAASAIRAMQDVAEGRIEAKFRVCSLPTGWGKTTCAVAFLAAMYKHRYPGAFIVPTIDIGNEVTWNLEALLGPGCVLQFDERNSPNRIDRDICERYGLAFDDLPPVVTESERREAPLIVATHRMWTYDLLSERGLGVRHYRSEPRSLVVVDESPELLRTWFCLPSDMTKLLEACRRREEDAELAEVLAKVVNRMNQVMLATKTGSGFTPIRLVEAEDVPILRAHPEEDLCRFLVLAHNGFAFFDAQSGQFVAYSLDLPEGCEGPGSGHVILDATADLSAMLPLFEGGLAPDRPRGNYARLSITHLPHPARFRYTTNVRQSLALAREYAAWIKQTVLAHTEPGETVLVVAPLAVFEDRSTTRPDLNAGLLPIAEAEPVTWEGRHIFTGHWGDGVGSNGYRTAQAVFLFSEHHLPAWAYIAQHLGYHRRPMPAVTGWKLRRGDENPLDEPYAQARDRHLLRWTKQLACRGNVRNVGPDGICGPMRLYTTMDWRRLKAHHADLFPGAPEPKFLPAPVSRVEPDQGDTSQGRKRLAEILLARQKDAYSSKELEALTGLDSRNLRRYLASPTVRVAAQGWTLKASRGRGQQSWLVWVGQDRHSAA